MYAKNDKILIRTKQCVYTGIVKAVNENRIALRDVSIPKSNSKPAGTVVHFHFNDIIESRLLEKGDRPEKDSCSTSESLAKNEILSRVKELQHTYRMLTNLTNNFYPTIDLLKKKSEIGIIMEDVSLGRKNRGSILTISCDTNIFVFDLEMAGDLFFDKGLREIFENPGIKKISHDVRLLSDCLYHKHLTTLENVRDTEAMDIAVNFQQKHIIRKNTRSLSQLVEKYFNVKELSLELNSIMKEKENFKTRPLSKECEKGLVIRASYLIPLHQAIEKAHSEILTKISEVYNKNFRDCERVYELTDIKKTLKREISSEISPVFKNVRDSDRMYKQKIKNKNKTKREISSELPVLKN